MWVVDMNTFEIHAEPNASTPTSTPTPMPTPSRKRKAASTASGASTPAGKQARRSRAAAVNGTCAPDQLLCRYANKKCLNPRAVKRSGGLHTFCAMHRANANRNQRRLDMRKRLQRQQQQAQPAVQGDGSSGSSSDDSASYAMTLAPLQIPQLDVEALYEPLAAPTPLEEEDVSTLVTLFLSDSFLLANDDELCAEDAQTFSGLMDAALSM
jgi:hypothetical protein